VNRPCSTVRMGSPTRSGLLHQGECTRIEGPSRGGGIRVGVEAVRVDTNGDLIAFVSPAVDIRPSMEVGSPARGVSGECERTPGKKDSHEAFPLHFDTCRLAVGRNNGHGRVAAGRDTAHAVIRDQLGGGLRIGAACTGKTWMN
jgi:hypothetical protein